MENQSAPPEGGQNRLYAIVAYIPFLCFVSLFGRESDEFTRNHGRQGLLLLVLEIVALIMLSRVGYYFWMAVLLLCLVLAVAGIASVFSGKGFNIPYISRWADKL